MENTNQTNQPFIDMFTDGSLSGLQENIAAAQVLMSRYRCAILEVETKFRVLNEQFSLQHERNPIESIKTRLKSPASIGQKLQKKGIPFSLQAVEQELNDVAGVRVICSFIDDIYMLADCLVHQDDVTLIERKDYIENPKPNGYRSLHLIIEIPIFLQQEKRNMRVEVQLRTIAMEFWANTEHQLRYKKNLDEATLNETADALMKCADTSAMLDVEMQRIKNIIEKK